MPYADEQRRPTTEVLANKVPAVTVGFWALKALTTAMGESASDFLVHAISPEAAVLLGFAAFCVAMTIQLRSRRYVPWVYWLAVCMVGVFGTMAADVLHVGLGVPYIASTIAFAVTLTAIFVAWHRTERTLSVHSINTRRREIFYWLAVVATFALGTAAGDLLAVTLHFGYLSAGLAFSGMILLPLAGYVRFRIDAVLTFWTGYVLTRPLGASYADWLSVPHARGGLDLGPGPVSAILIGLIACSVACMSFVRTAADRENTQARSEVGGVML